MASRSRTPAPDLRAALADAGLVLDITELSEPARENDHLWLATFLGTVAWFMSYPSESKFVWRGHAEAGWSLQPSLHRHVVANQRSATAGDVTREESRILAEVRDARMIERPDHHRLEVLAQLQHHGVPTRLLDVTQDPLVALFHAGEDGAGDAALLAIREPDGSTVVPAADGWTFTPPQRSYGIWEAPPIDRRIISQRGQFVVYNLQPPRASLGAIDPTAAIGIGIPQPRGRFQGDVRELFTQWLRAVTPSAAAEPGPGAATLRGGPNVVMFVIPGDKREVLRGFVRAAGLSARTIFPDLAGYAQSFRRPLA